MLNDTSSLQEFGFSPLHQASLHGHDAVAAVLLSKGVNVNQINNKGISPLHIAVFNGREAVVAVLLSYGADVNQEDNKGYKSIDVADTKTIKDMLIAHTKKKLQEQEQVQVQESAEQQPQSKGEAPPDGQAVSPMVDESQWFQAAEQGNLALIQQGINDKIDVNCQDTKGRTAMYFAAEKGHLGLVEYLISQHADLHIVENVSGDDVVFVVLSTPRVIRLTCTIIPVTSTLIFHRCMILFSCRTTASLPSISLFTGAMRLWLIFFYPTGPMSTKLVIRATDPSMWLLSMAVRLW